MSKKLTLIYLLATTILYACDTDAGTAEYYYSNPDTTKTKAELNEPATTAATTWPISFEIGRKASRSEIEAWDIDVRPDGKGLPQGKGDVSSGREIYLLKCVACHGLNGTGAANARLVGVMGDTVKTKTIGNYWPYSSTLFDYIRRAMPYNAPGSLKNNEVYSLTAYLLFLNQIIDSTEQMNRRTLPKVIMPAREYYVNDDRHGGPEIK